MYASDSAATKGEIIKSLLAAVPLMDEQLSELKHLYF